MITAPYDNDRNYDGILHKIVKDIDIKLNKYEDDFLLLCCGTGGTGKSMLMLHVMKDYLKEEASVDYIGLDKEEFATSLKSAKDKKLPRFCGNDEANISKREALAKYNKDLLDLYLSIRGLRILHWWNNPSLDIIDKPFIEERIKGVIFITTKCVNRPRIYYYFRKTDLLRIWEKYKSLKLNLLKKVKKKYAYFRGWFKDYNGELKQAYLDKKNKRMDNKVDTFYDKYGAEGEYIKFPDAMRLLGISRKTLQKYEKIGIDSGRIKQEEIKTSATGRIMYLKKMLPIFEEIAKEMPRNTVNPTNIGPLSL